MNASQRLARWMFLRTSSRTDTVMDNATSQIATRRNQRDSSKCRRLALGT